MNESSPLDIGGRVGFSIAIPGMFALLAGAVFSVNALIVLGLWGLGLGGAIILIGAWISLFTD